MNLPSGESLVRQIVHGQRYFEEQFGVRCTEVWIPDVFGYPAGLPQIFAAGGMRPLRHPEAVVEQAEPVPAQHVLVGGHRRHEGAHPLPAGRHLQRRDHAGRARVRRRATSTTTAGATESLMPFGYGDGGGGPTREMLERGPAAGAISTAARRSRSARPTTFFERVEAEVDARRADARCGAASCTSRCIAAR